MTLKCWVAVTVGDVCLFASVLLWRLNARMIRVMVRELEGRSE